MHSTEDRGPIGQPACRTEIPDGARGASTCYRCARPLAATAQGKPEPADELGCQSRRSGICAGKTDEPYQTDIAAMVIDRDAIKIYRMEEWCLEGADDCLANHGLLVDDQSRRTLGRAIAAIQRASLTLAKLAKGEGVAEALFSPAVSAALIPRPSQRPVSFEELVNGWAAERRPVAKTRYEWSRVIRELEKYLGHNDAHRLTAEDLVEWKRSMDRRRIVAENDPEQEALLKAYRHATRRLRRSG
jgi:hypothetical protein